MIDWLIFIYLCIYLFFGFYKILTNAWPTPPSAMSTPIAVTQRDRIIAPVIEDIAEMERRVLVTMFTYWFIDLFIFGIPCKAIQKYKLISWQFIRWGTILLGRLLSNLYCLIYWLSLYMISKGLITASIISVFHWHSVLFTKTR